MKKFKINRNTEIYKRTIESWKIYLFILISSFFLIFSSHSMINFIPQYANGIFCIFFFIASSFIVYFICLELMFVFIGQKKYLFVILFFIHYCILFFIIWFHKYIFPSQQTLILTYLFLYVIFFITLTTFSCIFFKKYSTHLTKFNFFIFLLHLI